MAEGYCRITNSSPPKRATMSELAHGGAQPVGDGAQQLVAAGMAERIVDLLELVEIDEVDGERTAAAQGVTDASIWSRNSARLGSPVSGIVARELVDLGLRHLAVGDVLEQHDAAPVGHRVEGEGSERPLGVSNMKLLIFAREALLELDGETPPPPSAKLCPRRRSRERFPGQLRLYAHS